MIERPSIDAKIEFSNVEQCFTDEDRKNAEFKKVSPIMVELYSAKIDFWNELKSCDAMLDEGEEWDEYKNACKTLKKYEAYLEPYRMQVITEFKKVHGRDPEAKDQNEVRERLKQNAVSEGLLAACDSLSAKILYHKDQCALLYYSKALRILQKHLAKCSEAKTKLCKLYNEKDNSPFMQNIKKAIDGLSADEERLQQLIANIHHDKWMPAMIHQNSRLRQLKEKVDIINQMLNTMDERIDTITAIARKNNLDPQTIHQLELLKDALRTSIVNGTIHADLLVNNLKAFDKIVDVIKVYLPEAHDSCVSLSNYLRGLAQELRAWREMFLGDGIVAGSQFGLELFSMTLTNLIPFLGIASNAAAFLSFSGHVPNQLTQGAVHGSPSAVTFLAPEPATVQLAANQRKTVLDGDALDAKKIYVDMGSMPEVYCALLKEYVSKNKLSIAASAIALPVVIVLDLTVTHGHASFVMNAGVGAGLSSLRLATIASDHLKQQAVEQQLQVEVIVELGRFRETLREHLRQGAPSALAASPFPAASSSLSASPFVIFPAASSPRNEPSTPSSGPASPSSGSPSSEQTPPSSPSPRSGGSDKLD